MNRRRRTSRLHALNRGLELFGCGLGLGFRVFHERQKAWIEALINPPRPEV